MKPPLESFLQPSSGRHLLFGCLTSEHSPPLRVDGNQSKRRTLLTHCCQGRRSNEAFVAQGDATVVPS